MFGKMFRFARRAVTSKTGRAALGVIATTVGNSVTEQHLGVGVKDVPLVGGFIDLLIGPGQAEAAFALMLLRDRGAKKDHPHLV